VSEQIVGYANPDGSGRGNWSAERRPDGTLIRREPEWFSAGALRARAGIVEHGEELVAVIDEGEVWCPACGYATDLHDGRCPTEAEAREAWGR
jgi:hypothetical protein